MAKKKESLTPEERLQAALAQESEQPYKVPENWCWAKVGALSNLYRGVSYKKHDAHAERQEQDCLILRGGNVLEGAIETETSDNVYVNRNLVQEDQFLQPYDIVIVSSTGSSKVIGRAGITYVGYDDVAFGAFLTLVRPNNRSVKPFIAYYFQSDIYRNRIRELASGVNINNIKANYITESPIPLPPFNEQQRIVDRIESLFTKLDEAKQKAQNALDSFETRKAAILHKAFTGKLTAQWRKEHGVRMESWEKGKLGKYVDTQYGYTESSSQKQVGPKFLRITDIQDGIVNWANVPFCEISDVDFERYAVLKNDIVVARTGATTGKSYLIVDDVKAVFASYLIRIKIKSPKLQPQYLYDFMQSQMYWGQITEFSAGIAQPGVNAKKLKEIELPIPSVPEQVEIARILDSLQAKERQAKEAAEGVLEQIDLIKKSILARAFRGELGTNNPNEESSISLLKEIIFSAQPKKVTSRSDKPVEVEIPIAIQKQLTTAVQEKVYRYVLENPLCTVEQVSVIEKNVLEAVQALRELEEKSLILRNPKDDTLAVVI